MSDIKVLKELIPFEEGPSPNCHNCGGRGWVVVGMFSNWGPSQEQCPCEYYRYLEYEEELHSTADDLEKILLGNE